MEKSLARSLPRYQAISIASMVVADANLASIQEPAPAADHRVSMRPSTAFSGRLPSCALAVTDTTCAYVSGQPSESSFSDSMSPQAVKTRNNRVSREIDCSLLLMGGITSARHNRMRRHGGLDHAEKGFRKGPGVRAPACSPALQWNG